ncbi:hypothetical protein ACQP1G_26160 [Nocardia sp. CA-107356]|uniref:hypothetical protein n=1 Tax=Nocardia sp. CA-107356 TaxID=3239972 RepID=UPI003D91EAD6
MNALLNGRHLLRVLEDCESVTDLEAFRHIALEGMARHLGCGRALFMAGTTVELCRQDPQMTGAHGLVERMIEPYLDTFYRYNVFAEPAAVSLTRRQGVVSLDQFPQPRTESFARFRNDYLFRYGIHAELAAVLRYTPISVVAMGVMDPESGAFGPIYLQLVGLLGRHLGNLVGWHTDELIETAKSGHDSPRQVDAAASRRCCTRRQRPPPPRRRRHREKAPLPGTCRHRLSQPDPTRPLLGLSNTGKTWPIGSLNP